MDVEQQEEEDNDEEVVVGSRVGCLFFSCFQDSCSLDGLSEVCGGVGFLGSVEFGVGGGCCVIIFSFLEFEGIVSCYGDFIILLLIICNLRFV